MKVVLPEEDGPAMEMIRIRSRAAAIWSAMRPIRFSWNPSATRMSCDTWPEMHSSLKAPTLVTPIAASQRLVLAHHVAVAGGGRGGAAAARRCRGCADRGRRARARARARRGRERGSPRMAPGRGEERAHRERVDLAARDEPDRGLAADAEQPRGVVPAVRSRTSRCASSVAQNSSRMGDVGGGEPRHRLGDAARPARRGPPSPPPSTSTSWRVPRDGPIRTRSPGATWWAASSSSSPSDCA